MLELFVVALGFWWLLVFEPKRKLLKETRVEKQSKLVPVPELKTVLTLPSNVVGSGVELCRFSPQTLEGEIRRLENMNLEPNSAAFARAMDRCDELEYAAALVAMYGNRASQMWPSNQTLSTARNEIERQLQEKDQIEFIWSPFSKGEEIIARRSPDVFSKRISDALREQGFPPINYEDVEFEWFLKGIIRKGSLTFFKGSGALDFVLRMAALASKRIDVRIIDLDYQVAIQALDRYQADLRHVKVDNEVNTEIPLTVCCKERKINQIPKHSVVLMRVAEHHPQAWHIEQGANELISPLGDKHLLEEL